MLVDYVAKHRDHVERLHDYEMAGKCLPKQLSFIDLERGRWYQTGQAPWEISSLRAIFCRILIAGGLQMMYFTKTRPLKSTHSNFYMGMLFPRIFTALSRACCLAWLN